jgi:formiminotetrahydrofolate cyclodeaminase
MYTEKPFKDFFNDLASEKSSPGGGSVAALTGVQAISLVLMVANLTLGKKKYDSVQQDIKNIIEKGDSIKASLMGKVDEDISIFQEIMDCYKLPKDKREEPLQEALKKSANFSFSMVNEGLDIMNLAFKIAEIGNKNLISDGAIALLLGLSTIKSSIINVKINLKPLKDSNMVNDLETKMQNILDEGKAVYAKSFEIINQYI